MAGGAGLRQSAGMHPTDAHDAAVARDLDYLGLPPRAWTAVPEGVLDVLVVGAGM